VKPFSRDTLHVYASEHPHEAATIMGTPDALRRLRDAIDRALANKRAECAIVFASDGEGYAAVVHPCEDMTDTWLPYAQLHSYGGRVNPTSAEDLRRIFAEQKAGKGIGEPDPEPGRPSDLERLNEAWCAYHDASVVATTSGLDGSSPSEREAARVAFNAAFEALRAAGGDP
jgi:hypothetical protein